MITKEQYNDLKWAGQRAKELLGAHTGGPNEDTYKKKLTSLRRTLRHLKWLSENYDTFK
jgi:hypothetical protein